MPQNIANMSTPAEIVINTAAEMIPLTKVKLLHFGQMMTLPNSEHRLVISVRQSRQVICTQEVSGQPFFLVCWLRLANSD